MIKHVNFKLEYNIWIYLVQYLSYRKRRHVTSCYTYSSHGLFYVLFLLIYGVILLHTITFVSAESFNQAHIIDGEMKKNNHMEQLVAAVKAEEAEEEYFENDEEKEYQDLISNKSAKGLYIGAPCNDNKCNSKLHHVKCDLSSDICSCEKKYPVIIGLTKGCAKPKRLEEQCFYDQTCMHNDVNSLCIQVSHNAKCQCVNGYHSVSYLKPTKRVFCTEDMATLTSDLPTLLGVTSGIAVLAGLICMVLHLFSKTKYPRHRSFNDANLPPPIMYSSDTGSRRPSLASVQSSSSSIKSFSAMRFEKEIQQKELRQEMKSRLTRLQQQQQLLQNKPHIIVSDSLFSGGAILKTIALTTPSPITPNSLDELLPCVIESQEPTPPAKLKRNEVYYIGPCTSLSENILD